MPGGVAGRADVADPVIVAACGGDGEAFAALVEPLRRELHLHCYRMLGTLHDADDALQETLLRAWRGLPGYQPRRPLRAWLYRIATNVCLTALAARSRDRSGLTADGLVESLGPGALRLDPYPDVLAADPERSAELREDVELAFLAALQVLPPRQRAVLLLRDVLDLSASEVAGLLGASVAAVNSALQRARATCAAERKAGRLARAHVRGPADAEASLLHRFCTAWRAADHTGLARLLAEDALLTMPPGPVRVLGREAVIAFLLTVPHPGCPGWFRAEPFRANGQPALALYQPAQDGQPERPHAVLVAAMAGGVITSLTRFGSPDLLQRFPLFVPSHG
jgi:RNA polymerase sigma-70 factor (ECF subfamily)